MTALALLLPPLLCLPRLPAVQALPGMQRKVEWVKQWVHRQARGQGWATCCVPACGHAWLWTCLLILLVTALPSPQTRTAAAPPSPSAWSPLRSSALFSTPAASRACTGSRRSALAAGVLRQCLPAWSLLGAGRCPLASSAPPTAASLCPTLPPPPSFPPRPCSAACCRGRATPPT